MRPLESAVAHPRRRIRTFSILGASLAAASVGVGVLLFFLGRTRPDVTLTFSEFGLYVAVLGALHALLYAGLFWHVGRLSRRPRALPTDVPTEST